MINKINISYSDMFILKEEQWEFENLRLLERREVPEEDIVKGNKFNVSIQKNTVTDKSIFTGSEIYNGYVIKTDKDIPEDAYLLKICNRENYAIIDIKDFDKFLEEIKIFTEKREKLLIEADKIGYPLYYAPTFSVDENLDFNMARLKVFEKEISDKEESIRASKEGTEEMKILSNKFNEIGLHTIEGVTFEKDKINIPVSFSLLDFDIDIILLKPLTGIELSKLDYQLKDNNSSGFLSKLSAFLRGTDFILSYNDKKIIHTIEGEKFKIKHKKNLSWVKDGEKHYDIVKLEEIENVFNIITFYENNKKPVGEYYNTLIITDEDGKDYKIPATFTHIEKSEYEITIKDGISFKKQMSFSKNKNKVFESLKSYNFSYNIKFLDIYRRLKNDYPKEIALEKIKELKTLFLI